MKRLHSLSIRDLHILQVLDMTRSLGRATTELGTSVAALSRRLTRIENLLGMTLFERGVNGTMITAPGRRVLQHARRMIAEAHHLLALGSGTVDSLEGEIRLGLACPPLHPMVETWLRLWNEAHPRTRIGLYGTAGGNHDGPAAEPGYRCCDPPPGSGFVRFRNAAFTQIHFHDCTRNRPTHDEQSTGRLR